MELQELIAQLKNDSRSYHFCKDGLKGVASVTSVLQCVAMLRENIVYCFDSDYHQVIAENIEMWYGQWKKEFNLCGIWVNECPENGDGIVVIVSQDLSNYKSQQWLVSHARIIIGKCRCFVFGVNKMRVCLFDQSKIYSKNPNARIHLFDHSHGFIKFSNVNLCNSSVCYAESAKVYLYDRSHANLTKSCLPIFFSVGPKVATIEHLGFQ